MNINECIEQLNSLLEHFENGGNDFYATDVIAIKSLLEENKKLNGAIKTYDILLKANAEENKKLKEVIDKVHLIIKKIAYGGDEDYYIKKITKIYELLKEVSE